MALRRYLIVSFAGLLGLVGWLRAGERPPVGDQVRFFESRIRPLLADHCFKCHGPEKQRADLRLDSRDAVLKGGQSGPAVIPGRPENSLLIHAVGYGDDERKMPPKGKLSDRQIADLTQWIKMGAPFSPQAAKSKTKAAGEHWAFRAPLDPLVPTVKDVAWPRSPLDRFVLSQLEAKGLRPAPPADRRTLIRRATFDLIGLPPTSEEVEAFISDDSPMAFARVVDRLLASQHYGERWGRHWLDVARYADSNGLDENVAFGNAWRYRDYVVTAFNQNRPYDQFLLEQLAGDLLSDGHPSSRNERLIATGFLALGPKVLAEGDEKKMELDIIDEQIDTLGRAVLGMTIGCARCHDHKFDPITTRDYHGLAGIFTSTRTMENFKRVARWHENLLDSEVDRARKAKHDKEVARQKERIQQVIKQATDKLKADVKSNATLPKEPEPLFPAEKRAELKRLRDELASLEKSAPVLPTAMGVTEGKVTDLPVFMRGDHLRPGKIVPRQVPVVLASTSPTSFDSRQSGRLELARWLVRPDHPLTARVMVNRIWRWRFGQGLVPTPDNFGLLGEAPVNQPLLDWLARRFIEQKWSVKAMHRLMMLSATYQQSSRPADSDRAFHNARLIDPENRLNWRANVKRLEAETIRDNLLAVAGLLDRSMAGSLLHVKNREYFFDHTSKDTTKYDSRRRSIYLPVVRNNVYDVFQLFDFPDPAVANGDRATTTVPTQALFWLNRDLVADVCTEWARALLMDSGLDHAGRVEQVYRKAYARMPTAEESRRATELIRNLDAALARREANVAQRRLQAWASFCQTIVSANEFVYVH